MWKQAIVTFAAAISLELLQPMVSCAEVNAQVTLRDDGISPTQITATKGDTLKIHVTNQGKSVHNFVIPEMYIFTKNLAPGETTDVSFVPDKTGRFPYYSDTGGEPEPGIRGTLVV